MYYVGERGLRPPLPQGCPFELVSLIKMCLQHDPQFRPDFTQILSVLESLEPIDPRLFPFPVGASSTYSLTSEY